MPRYRSTRGGDTGRPFEEVLLATYASDGGLFVPEAIPQLTPTDLLDWYRAGWSYARVCTELFHRFTEIDCEALLPMMETVCGRFNVEAGLAQPLQEEEQREQGQSQRRQPSLPISRVSEALWLLDLSLGPTLAFKDVGQQMVAQLINYYLSRRSDHAKATILVETSGDTGPAALAAAAGCPFVEIYCLYPRGRVSPVQELQMITNQAPNVHVYRTEGDTDDQAAALKALFEDQAFAAKHRVCSINSINWGRIVAQSTYYFWAYLSICGPAFASAAQSELPVLDVCIPTGAFGNAAGALLAKKMGLPLGRILCATNANDIVHRTISHGDLSMGENLPTYSPAMDIQFAYNLERMLYFISEDPVLVRELMEAVYRKERVQLPPALLASIQSHFLSRCVSNADTLAAIKAFHATHGFVLCPHSAVGVFAATEPAILAALRENRSIDGTAPPLVTVLTAHWAKFEDTIRLALGPDADLPLPPSVQALKTLPHRFQCLERAAEEAEQVWMPRWIARLRSDIEQLPN